MASTDDAYLGAGIPEADRLDQEQQADPAAEEVWEWPNHAGMNVDEADRLEQALAVLGDPDEEYTWQSPERTP